MSYKESKSAQAINLSFEKVPKVICLFFLFLSIYTFLLKVFGHSHV